MKVLVVIVAYKDKKNLEECLKSLNSCFSKNEGDIFDIHVHDNSDNNLGFAGGVNEVLRLASLAQGKLEYDLVWLLNPDCIIKIKNQKSKIKIKESFNNIDFDIWSPVVYDEQGEIWFAGGKINRWTGECEHQKTVGQWNSETVAGETWVSGCSMFIRAQVFERIGFFDEKFFLFYEDVDFCLRAKEAGFRIGVVGKARIEGRENLEGIDGFKVVHKASQSVNKLPNKYEIEMKSKFYLLKKHGRYFWSSAYLISKLRYLKHKLVKGA